MTNATLPQNDPDAAERAARLAAAREQYVITHERVPGIAVLAAVPEHEQHSADYLARRAEAEKDMGPNAEAITKREPFAALSVEDCEALFSVLEPPRVTATWRTDGTFAEHCLAGPNPFSLRAVDDRLPDGCLVEDRHAAAALGEGTTVAGLIGEGRLFVVDHREALAGVRSGVYPAGNKYCPKPMGLFAWTPSEDGGALLPVAVQVDTGEDAAAVFTPTDDPALWNLAKTCFHIADATVHEMGRHLGQTHLVMSPFAIATGRQLADTHPVGLLLRPHFVSMLAINDHALDKLINPGGPVDVLWPGTLQETVGVALKAALDWSVDSFALPNRLESRGVHDTSRLPHYPYRDDGLLLWEAIGGYVRDYLRLYYADDAAIAADTELQAWAAELVAQDGGRVKGMPGSFDTVEQLAGVLTVVIYTCSAFHSVVNYTQYEYMAFVPNRPLSGYSDYRTFLARAQVSAEEAAEFTSRFLPPFAMTCGQLELMARLSLYQHDRLGEHDWFSDPAAKEAQGRFQQALRDAGAVIDQRNAQRRIPFPFLEPSLVLNSISI